MPFSVPLLLEKSLAVIYRLNLDSTNDVQPASGVTSGYNHILREPVVYDDTIRGRTTRKTARSEYPAIRIPCQVEPLKTDEARQLPQGKVPDIYEVLVFHSRDLKNHNLIDKATGEILLKDNDRITALEPYRSPKKSVYTFSGDGAFIYHIQPRSYGFGANGHDLFIVYLAERQKAR
jgi:hypothetical protein